MIGKMAIHLEEQFGGVHVEALQNFVHHGAARTVTGVKDCCDAPREVELSRNLRDVGGNQIGSAFAARSALQIARFHQTADFLNGLAVNGGITADGFESIDSEGLWLPVIITAPSAFRWNTE